MKQINNYITEKLHVGKGMQSNYEDKINALKIEIIDILHNYCNLNEGDYRFYSSNNTGAITDYVRIDETTRFVIYISKDIQTKEWKGKNKRKHKEVINALERAKLIDIDSIELGEHQYIANRLKIIIHIKRDS